MNLATGLGGIFIVLGVTALAFCTNYKYETHWIVISLEEAAGLVWFLYILSCFENVHTRRSRDTG